VTIRDLKVGSCCRETYTTRMPCSFVLDPEFVRLGAILYISIDLLLLQQRELVYLISKRFYLNF